MLCEYNSTLKKKMLVVSEIDSSQQTKILNKQFTASGFTSSRTRVSRDSLMDAALSMPPDKHFATQAGVEIKISGGPANAARCKHNSETITTKHILNKL